MPGWRNLPTGRQVGRRTGLKMFYVYAIKSLTRNYVYVGLTNNIERRISEHNSGRNKTKRAYKPFKLIYSKEFENRIDAREREKYLKTDYGKEFLKGLSN